MIEHVIWFVVGLFLGAIIKDALDREWRKTHESDEYAVDKFGNRYLVIAKGESGMVASDTDTVSGYHRDYLWSKVYWEFPSHREEASVRMDEQNIRRELIKSEQIEEAKLRG